MITEIIARLKANKVALGIALVGGATDFSIAAASNPVAVPAVYVVPLDEMPGQNALSGMVEQRVDTNVALIFVVRNVADPMGDTGRGPMETLRAAVKGSLYGWMPSAGFDPLERGRSTLLAFRDGHQWWQDIYSTAYYDRSVA